MNRYNYIAKDNKTGEIIKGSVQAENKMAAGKLLVERNMVPRQLREFGSGPLDKFLNRITAKDRITFTRQFATLIGAGVPLSESLRTVAEQTENKSMKAVVEDVTTAVDAGEPLAQALGRYPKTFDHVYIELIKAGELSGTLDKALMRLANQLEKDAAVLSKIRSALMYPVIVVVVIIAVMGFMLFTIVPQVEGLYDDLGEPLPVLTQIMVRFANFLIEYWWVVAIIAAIIAYMLFQFTKSKKGIQFRDLFYLNVPMFKQLFRRLYMGRFARTAQILLSTGVPMVETLKISTDAVNNVIVQENLEKATARVANGKALSESLKIQKYIMPILPQMIAIGESSGKIDEMLGKAATVLEDELDEMVRTISTMIEPILMVLLAVMAGGMIAAVLFPIYSLVETV
ncbi:MAG: type II secretion system F family protein [Candidatus Nomurabacteria bacterium]|jgi:type IV pilus assembly protein PilC|nr:type II secretion system F family protein [Candidatus Nomurabacteria bacterium]